MRAELPKVKLQKEADEKLLKETEARKAELKTQEPLPTKEIACTAEIDLAGERSGRRRYGARRTDAPRCLNREFRFRRPRTAADAVVGGVVCSTRRS